MNTLQVSLITVFLILAVLYTVINFQRMREMRSFIIVIVILTLLNIFLGYPRIIEERGSEGWIMYVYLFIVMIAGMAARYFYFQINNKTKRVRFSVFPFLKPFFVSPLVFIPLVDLVPENQVSLKSAINLMLLAFQTGFFWMSFFDPQEKEDI